MFDEEFELHSPTGAALHVYAGRAPGRPRGIVLIHHGLAEHAGRYARFAGDLAAHGFHVYAHDHRGHGKTTAPDAPLRRFARRDGAHKVLADCRAVHDRAERDHPGLPVVVFGHSMGGLIALNYAEENGSDLAGLAVWNANFRIGFQQRVARLVLRAEKALKGSDVPSAILQRATFEAWGRSIEPRRTMADWLSHDEAIVDRYLADPACGFSPTISMMEDVLGFIFAGVEAARLGALPKALPVHLLGGTADPATDKAEATGWLAARMHRAGLRNVTTETIVGARHETLNETDRYRTPALASLLAWLERITVNR